MSGHVTAQSQPSASSAGIVIRDKAALGLLVTYYCATAGRNLAAYGVIDARWHCRNMTI